MSSRPSRAPSVDIPRSGPFRNALTPDEMMDLPFTRPITEQDVSPPALPILLMHYGRCRDLDATVTVSSGNREIVAPIAATHFAPVSLNAREEFLAAFLWREGTYSIETGNLPSDVGRYSTESLAKIAIEGIRGALLKVPDDAILGCIGDDFLLAPKVTKRGLAMAEALGFWKGEKRFLKYRCDGTIPGKEAVNAGSVSQSTALRTLFVVHMLGQIKWEEIVQIAGPSLAERVEAKARRLKGANEFDVLEVHWSASADEAQQAHDRLVDQYGPASEAAQAAPGAAASIVERVRQALPILLDPHKRMALLRRTHPDLDFQSIADLLRTRAVALSLKGQDGDANDAKRVQREVAPLARHAGYDRRIFHSTDDPPKRDE